MDAFERWLAWSEQRPSFHYGSKNANGKWNQGINFKWFHFFAIWEIGFHFEYLANFQNLYQLFASNSFTCVDFQITSNSKWKVSFMVSENLFPNIQNVMIRKFESTAKSR